MEIYRRFPERLFINLTRKDNYGIMDMFYKMLKGRSSVKERKIKLIVADDVREFVSKAEKCNFDIDIFYNRVIVDGKSLLGVFSLDLSRILTVKYAGNEPEFEGLLDKFAV